MIEFGKSPCLGKSFCSIEPGTAMLVAGGLGAGGSIFSGIMGSSAAAKSAAAIRYAADVARQTALEIDTKQRADLQPFMDIGKQAGGQLQNLLTGTTDIRQTTQASPLYQFLSELQNRDINRQLSARGLYNSGAGLEILQRGQTQLVGEEGERIYNRLANQTTLGANAAARAATNTVQTGGALIGAQAQLGQQLAGYQGAQYNALGQGIGGAFGQAGNLLAYYPQLQQNLETQRQMGNFFSSQNAGGGWAPGLTPAQTQSFSLTGTGF